MLVPHFTDSTHNCTAARVLDNFRTTVLPELNEMPYDKMQWDPQRIQAVDVPMNVPFAQVGKEGVCNIHGMMNAVMFRLRQLGIDHGHDHVELWMDERFRCGWAGTALVRGSRSWERMGTCGAGGVTSGGVRIKELGHNFDLHVSVAFWHLRISSCPVAGQLSRLPNVPALPHCDSLLVHFPRAVTAAALWQGCRLSPRVRRQVRRPPRNACK